MSNLICINHSKYKGAKAPELSCVSCCHIFITEVKRQRAEGLISNQESFRQRFQLEPQKKAKKAAAPKRAIRKPAL